MLPRPQTHPQQSCPPQPFSHVLTAADEFALICSWLGKGHVLPPRGEAISPVPAGTTPMPPTMLMDFEEGGRCLITIKVKAANKLTFKPHHVEALRRNAAQLALPLLIAWKRFSVWTLFDVSHLSRGDQNDGIDHALAAKQNLLGVLAQDVAFTLSRQIVPTIEGHPVTEERIIFAHQRLVRSLQRQIPVSADLCLDGLAGEEGAVGSLDDFMNDLRRAQSHGIVSQIFRQRPYDLPEFLASRGSWMPPEWKN